MNYLVGRPDRDVSEEKDEKKGKIVESKTLEKYVKKFGGHLEY